MREIKFRAWLWDERELHYVLKMDTVNNGYGKVWMIDTFHYKNISHFGLMQFTGLNDKNGVEIYEGDICSNEVAKWEVIFDTGCFCGKRIGGSDGTQNIHLALRAIRELSVIGNIHENPSLI